MRIAPTPCPATLPTCMHSQHSKTTVLIAYSILPWSGMQVLPACKHVAEVPLWLQTQKALLDVLWGLDEQALPGCAAGHDPMVRAMRNLIWDAGITKADPNAPVPPYLRSAQNGCRTSLESPRVGQY